MLRRRLDPERHGSGGYTSALRLAAMGMVAGFLVLGTHLAQQAWFNGRILPGVRVANRDLGGLTLPQAREAVRDLSAGYRIKLSVAGQQYAVSATQLGLTYDPETTVANAYRSGRDAWLPPLHHDPLPLAYHLDRSQLNAFASSVAAKVGTPPVDAGVVVSGVQLSAVPDKTGLSIDRRALERLIEDDAGRAGGGQLSLIPRPQLADIQVTAVGQTIHDAQQLMATPVILAYGDKTYTPTPAEIGQWLVFQKQTDGRGYKLVAQVDVAKLKRYTQTIANDIDVAAVPQKVNVENGVSKVTQAGQNGLMIDQDALTAAMAKAVTLQSPLTYTIASHPVAFKTITTTLISLDYSKYIEVNLSRQHLWAWENHQIVYESPITSGATGAGLGTVTGLFNIYYKTTNTHLVGYQYGYNYDVPVKYWMPFYKGYGLHDAVWRHGNFGGSDYYYGGSHGCVNLPDATAEFIYNWAPVGTPVWVHK